MVQMAGEQTAGEQGDGRNPQCLWTKQAAFWVVIWCAIALAIRLTHLASKPPWGDEMATILFSLGNSSRMIPLNEIISVDQILRPLQTTPGSTPWDVVRSLLAEDNHPPIYFVLAHPWMQLFARSDGYASLWAARALPAIFGALGVPAIYLLAWASFRNRAIALLCAALMAVSPFGVFLAQEARHYTLAILLVIASLICFVLSVRALTERKPPSWPTTFGWIVANALGFSVHYFSGLTIVAEALTLLVLLVRQCQTDSAVWRKKPWIRIYIAAAGTFASSVVWLPILLNFYGSPQSSFLRSGPSSWKYWIDPIAQSVAGWLYAVLSPITNGYGPLAVALIVVTCVFLLLVYAPWLIANLKRALGFQLHQPRLRVGLQAMGGFFIIANLIFLLICYGLGFDITRGHRYSFIFFPSILVLVGAGLAPFWQSEEATQRQLGKRWIEGQDSEEVAIAPSSKALPTLTSTPTPTPQKFSQVKLPFIQPSISGKAFVITVICIGFLGSQTITNNLSHLKFYKADRFINLVQAESKSPVVIGANTTITDQPAVVGIEIMSTAWEVRTQLNTSDAAQRWPTAPRFVIAENNAAKGFEADTQLAKSLKTVARPFDLWMLNASPDLAGEGCPSLDSGTKGSYRYAHYVCK